MVEIELKPCPFCGGKPEKRTFINSAGIYVYRVYCPQCQIGTMKHNSMKRACEKWNSRTEQPQEQKRGRWIEATKHRDENGTILIDYECSECFAMVKDLGADEIESERFCYNCGTDMREEGADNG